MKREGVLLSFELLLYSVEQTAELARAVSLGPLGEPRAQVEHEQPRKTVGQRNLEQGMTGAWWMTPPVVDYRHVAEEASRVRVSRAVKTEPGQARDALHHRWIPRLLERHHIRSRCFDHLGDLFGAADAALPDVVGEKAQV